MPSTPNQPEPTAPQPNNDVAPSDATELTLDTTKIAGAEALSALSAAVQQIEAERECVGADDVNGEAPEDEAPSEAPGDGN